MTNPDNIVRVRARNGGRASVYEANGWAQGYSSGLFEGTGVIQNTVADMNVLVGGSAAKPDVVLAENPSGYKIALDIVGQQAIAITAPATNNRVSAIVAYTDDLSLATTEDTVTGSPASCGLIVVNGTAALNPTEPTDAQIRTAITADGATGSQAAYAVLALVVVASSTTAITNSIIAPNKAVIDTNNIANNSITASKLDFTTFGTEGEQTLISTAITVGGLWTTIYGTTFHGKGRYVVMASCYGYNATGSGYISAKIVDTTDNTLIAQTFFGKYANNRVSVNIFGVVNDPTGAKDGHIFALQLITESGNVTVDGTANIAFLRVK